MSSSALVDERLPEEVVPDRLHPGEAGAGRSWCGSGRRRAARSPPRAASGSTARRRSSMVWRNWRSGLARPGRAAGEPAQLVDLLVAGSHRPQADTGRRRPALRGPGRPCCGERPQPREERVEARGTAPGGRAAAGSGRGRARRGAPCTARARPGSPAGERSVSASSSRRVAAISAVSPASRTNRVTSVLRSSSAPTTVSASAIRRSIVSRLAAEDAQRLARLAQARVGAAQHLAQVVGPTGQPGAQLGHDQPQPVAVGPAQDVVDEVDRDRRAGLLDRYPAAVGQALVGGARLTVHEVLADQRLGADLAAGVAAQIGEAGLGDLGLHQSKRPRLGARDPERRSCCPPGRRRP